MTKRKRRTHTPQPPGLLPTPERQQKGQFVLVDGEVAGVRYARDMGHHLLDRMHLAEQITAAQRDAGIRFLALSRATRLTSDTRSCLDIEPRGYEGDAVEEDGPDPWQTAYDLRLELGVRRHSALTVCCVMEIQPRDMGELRSGLDVCARFFGITE